MHADKTNRTMLILFGLLVLLTGIGAMLLSVGVFGTGRSHQTLLANGFGDFVGRSGHWLWPAAAVLSLIIVLLALRWIIALLVSTDRVSDINVPSDKPHGRTMVRSGALSAALTREIETYRGVESARARVIGDESAPELVVTVTLLRSADPAQLRERIESKALAHARQVLDNAELPIQLDLAVGTRTGQRV